MQPLSISETIGRPEPGRLGTLFLELDENAFNEAGKAEDGKEGEDIVGVDMERCVHCLAACICDVCQEVDVVGDGVVVGDGDIVKDVSVGSVDVISIADWVAWR